MTLRNSSQVQFDVSASSAGEKKPSATLDSQLAEVPAMVPP